MISKKYFNKKGFTIIELIVVIAIIAVLSGIVVVNTSTYINKARLARFKQEASNLEKALTIFYSKYGDYPGAQNNGEYKYFCPAASHAWCEGEPNLVKNGNTYYLSEFLKWDWDNPSITYYGPNGYYELELWDECGGIEAGWMDCDGKIGCGGFYLWSDNGWAYKYILCQDCPENCGGDGFY